jgi:branched-chain amino acid transport system substrate-binding protein
MRSHRLIHGLVTLILALATLVGVAPVPAAEEIRIGVVSPLTGPTAKFGQAQKNALTMAVEDVNGAGGIKSLGGAKIKLIFGDTRGEADIGVTETERLITREKVHALIGAFQSGVGFPSSAVAERHQVPWLTFGTFDKITERGFNFRARANDTMKARTLIEGSVPEPRERHQVGRDRPRTPSGEVGQRQAAAFWRRPGSGAFQENYPFASRPHLAHREGQGRIPTSSWPIPTWGRVLITRQMAEQELRPVVYAAGGGGHVQPDFLKGAGKLSEGIFAATMWDAAVGKNVPWIAKDNDRHVARFGAPFTEDSAGYYQGFYVIVDALERTKKLGTKELRDAIAATNITDINNKAMFLPYKQIKFDDGGQNPFATAMVVQTQGGKFRLLYPETVAEPDAKVVWPYLGAAK